MINYYNHDLPNQLGFSGYNNEERELSPTIIIRKSDISKKDVEENKLISEDIRDGSTILLSSNKYKNTFSTSIIDDGSTNFKTTPINFELPEEYTDFDQILLNSDRIILSLAKSQEMIFFSKGDYGFISDGRFIIDNGESRCQI